ncbi:hypothetical protein OH77DRAFT_548855 [Trametes cingulata]|nr:hypothetical protein OH77DRAFT_548855 [Trametes cingulata]
MQAWYVSQRRHCKSRRSQKGNRLHSSTYPYGTAAGKARTHPRSLTFRAMRIATMGFLCSSVIADHSRISTSTRNLV